MPFEDSRRLPEVADPSVRAASQKRHVDLLALDRLPFRETHVLQRFFRSLPLFFVQIAEGRNPVIQRNGLSRGDTPGNHGAQGVGVQLIHVVVLRVGPTGKAAPELHRFVERLPLGRVLPTFHVVKGGLVGIDVSHPSAALDAHVADRHALFHAQSVNRLTIVLVGVADPPVHTEVGYNLQNDILGVDAGLQLSGDVNLTHLGPTQRHRLRGQHIPNLRGSDTKSDRPKRSVGGGMAVTAGDRHAGLSQP